jgi:phospholipase C
MSLRRFASHTLHFVRMGLATVALFQFTIGASVTDAAPPTPSRDSETASPIKHVIVIIGENRSFDHVFATYVPKNGQHVWNLLSEHIVNADGTPGSNFSKAEQLAAGDQQPDAFLLSPPVARFPGSVLPAPLVGGPKVSYIPTTDATGNPLTQAQRLTLAEESENGLAGGYSPLLLSGGTGQTSKTPDKRITKVTSLPAGPFQLTNGKTFLYDDYAASPVHRFYQMWQQLDCSLEQSSLDNPSGCNARLFSWVETTVGAGTNGLLQPPPCSSEGDVLPCFTTNYLANVPQATTTGEGSTALGFYNVQKGDVPYFKSLADNYAMSDNFHQSVNGGTGANHIMLGHADAIWFSDGKGHPLAPPHGVPTGGTTSQGLPTYLDEVENPDPGLTLSSEGANNWYTEDGYGEGSPGASPYGGGSYTDCSDLTQPGVEPIVDYLTALNVNPRCQAGHYYLLNNYNPGYFGNGKNAFTDSSPDNTVFTIPPSSTPSIGDVLLAAGVSWKYYGDQWDNYVNDPYQINYGPVGSVNPLGKVITAADEYCTICNPFQYDTSIMANAAIRTAHIQDTANLYADIQNGTLPAVSFVKPSAFVDGHPASSKLDLFEGFVKKIVDLVQANPKLWSDTAIFITFDEGGGYYDSGYVQPLDFFGDGTRIPLLVVSPYATGGHISHAYADHVSIDKFIERNWGLRTITRRSRDNFPDPITDGINPYVPTNSPALTDLFDLFNFQQ